MGWVVRACTGAEVYAGLEPAGREFATVVTYRGGDAAIYPDLSDRAMSRWRLLRWLYVHLASSWHLQVQYEGAGMGTTCRTKAGAIAEAKQWIDDQIKKVEARETAPPPKPMTATAEAWDLLRDEFAKAGRPPIEHGNYGSGYLCELPVAVSRVLERLGEDAARRYVRQVIAAGSCQVAFDDLYGGR